MQVEALGGLACSWAIFVESNLVGKGGSQPVGDVLVALPLPTQHPACLPGEQGLCLSLRVEQAKASLGSWMAQLFHLEPAHCDSFPLSQKKS